MLAIVEFRNRRRKCIIRIERTFSIKHLDAVVVRVRDEDVPGGVAHSDAARLRELPVEHAELAEAAVEGHLRAAHSAADRRGGRAAPRAAALTVRAFDRRGGDARARARVRRLAGRLQQRAQVACARARRRRLQHLLGLLLLLLQESRQELSARWRRTWHLGSGLQLTQSRHALEIREHILELRHE